MTTVNTMLSQEDVLRDATRKAWEGLMAMGSATNNGVAWCNNTNDDDDDVTRSKYSNRHLHGDCSVFLLLDGSTGTYITGRPGSDMDWPSSLVSDGGDGDDGDTTTIPIIIEYVKILPVGMQSAASVQVRVGESHRGFFVLLKELVHNDDFDLAIKDDTTSTASTSEGNEYTSCWVWKCISMALAPVQDQFDKNTINKVLPDSFSQVTALVWDGYCHANRLCDGTLMARYFHPTCRLTYMGGPNDDHKIVIVESHTFYEMVQHRYTTLHPIHAPYAQWKDDPSVGRLDTLHSIEFVTPYLAMVILRIGHPPYLWTDLLTCARIVDTENDDDDRHNNKAIKVDNSQKVAVQRPKWWIIHKSSESEPHPLAFHRFGSYGTE